MGIRKVLGATVPDILLLFGREFIALIGLAFVIAAPLAWFAMHSWLENFAYRIGIGWGTFVLSIGVSFLIAAVTISYKSISAALMPPVKSLQIQMRIDSRPTLYPAFPGPEIGRTGEHPIPDKIRSAKHSPIQFLLPLIQDIGQGIAGQHCHSHSHTFARNRLK